MLTPSLRSLAVAFSVALFSASSVLALPTTHCHDNDSVTTLGETHDQAAALARNLVKNTGVGTFMSIMNANKMEGKLEGFPFGSMDYYVDDCQNSGKPLMLLSHLQINVQNANTDNKVSLAIRKLPAPGERSNPMVDPRVTLLGSIKRLEEEKSAQAEACFLARHPEARWWLPGSLHDFHWYTMDVEELYYIGGFGGIHYIGWINTETYFKAGQESVESAVENRFRVQA